MQNHRENQADASAIERAYDRPRRIRVIAGGVPFDLPMTTVAVGPRPGGGEMVADLSRFSPGDSVRVLGDEGSDYRALIL